MKKLLVITGPTGVGKTELCLSLAEYFSTPIINADSRQIYRELPIGTAAPTESQMKRVKHYFVGSLSVTDYYSASMYETAVMDLLSELFDTHETVILSGGSMMYIDAVCNGIDDIPTVDDKTRSELKARYEQEGLEALAFELARLDPEYYSVVDVKNPKRVIHALEICHMTGLPYSSFRTNKRKARPFDIVKIGLCRERTELYDRIDKRVDSMIAAGLPEEALRVYPYRELNALNTVGYKEMFLYLDGLYTLDEAAAKIKFNTHKYCRKQLTWFKRDVDMRWFHPDSVSDIIEYASM